MVSEYLRKMQQDSFYKSKTQSGREQVQQVKIVKTVREESTLFKLEEPIQEIFKRMRKVSQKVLDDLRPHPHYLQVNIPNSNFAEFFIRHFSHFFLLFSPIGCSPGCRESHNFCLLFF
jgi:enoyl reductase-like protein